MIPSALILAAVCFASAALADNDGTLPRRDLTPGAVIEMRTAVICTRIYDVRIAIPKPQGAGSPTSCGGRVIILAMATCMTRDDVQRAKYQAAFAKDWTELYREVMK